MDHQIRCENVFRLTIAGLVLYCLSVIFLTGDIGFEGDDWWIFSYPYWTSFPSSLFNYAKDSLRPVEGIYWIGLFEIFGFNKLAFHFFSVLLLAAGAATMGRCFLNAFPNRSGAASIAVLIAFFLPVVSCLTYVLATDNSRLSCLIFWSSVLLFQYWRMKGGNVTGLLLPVFVYIISFLAYESPSFKILAMPLLVWPIHKNSPATISDRQFLVRLGAAVIVALSIVVSIRFLLLSGGAVGHRHLVPPLELLGSYLGLIPFYLAAPFHNISTEAWAIAAGLFIFLLSLVVLLSVKHDNDSDERVQHAFGCKYIFATGFAFLILGLVPYLLAGYGGVPPKLVETFHMKLGDIPQGHSAWFNFNWSSRIYSAGSFGLAIMFSAIIAACWNRRITKILSAITVALVLGVFATFHAGLSKDWKEAARIRNGMMANLISQVPDVKPYTNFVFLDLEYYHRNAVVFRGWGGLRELMKMVYDDPNLNAWYMYPYVWRWPNEIYQQAFVSPEGFVSRGMDMKSPVPHESLIILKRKQNSVALIDELSSDDGQAPTGISWRNASFLHTNLDRIVSNPPVVFPPISMARNAWNSGLVSSLRLSRAYYGFRFFNKLTASLRDNSMRRHLLLK
jgi:hypothetical protein